MLFSGFQRLPASTFLQADSALPEKECLDLLLDPVNVGVTKFEELGGELPVVHSAHVALQVLLVLLDSGDVVWRAKHRNAIKGERHQFLQRNGVRIERLVRHQLLDQFPVHALVRKFL